MANYGEMKNMVNAISAQYMEDRPPRAKLPLTGGLKLEGLTFASKRTGPRNFALQSKFMLAEDTFISSDTNGSGNYGWIPLFSDSTVGYGLGGLTIKSGSGSIGNYWRRSDNIHPWGVQRYDVAAIGASGNQIQIGECNAAGNQNFYFSYTPSDKKVTPSYSDTSTISTSATFTLPADPKILYFDGRGRYIRFWADCGNGPILTHALDQKVLPTGLHSVANAEYDRRFTSVYSAKYPYFGVVTTSTDARFTSFKYALSGADGLFNPILCTYPNGEPIVIDDKIFICTNNVAGATSLNSSAVVASVTTYSVGIWSVNARTGTVMEEESRIYFLRNNTNGVASILSDLSVKPVYDPATKIWTVYYANAGDIDLSGNQQSYVTTYSGNLLKGIHYLSAGPRLTFANQTATDFYYDADVIYVNGVYYAIYVDTGFVMKLVKGTAITNMTLVGTSGSIQAEGPTFCKVGGEYRVVAYDRASNTFKSWDLTMTVKGTISVSNLFAFNTLSPHGVVFPVTQNGVTQYILHYNDEICVQTGAGDRLDWACGSSIFQASTATNTGDEWNSFGSGF